MVESRRQRVGEEEENLRGFVEGVQQQASEEEAQLMG